MHFRECLLQAVKVGKKTVIPSNTRLYAPEKTDRILDIVDARCSKYDSKSYSLKKIGPAQESAIVMDSDSSKYWIVA